ncbi:MAG: outer membrane protein assembly factor BamD [Desulfuromonadaceae bacterium]|nr:outer membrane protein assembly factor BamD [Desulfuromonadaceae bacterium]
MKYRVLLILVALLSTTACSTTPAPKEEAKNALYYFQQGEIAYEDQDYEQAIENWQKVRDSFQSPELTTLAELKIADVQYEKGQTIEAIAAYEDFLKQHPEHARTGEVLLRLGQLHFGEMLSEDRDQTATRNALASLKQLKDNYPAYNQQGEVDQLIQQCRDRLAANERYIGQFYLKNKRYDAAINRLKEIPANYPEFPEMNSVLFSLAKAYTLSGQNDKATPLFNLLERAFQDADLRDELTEFRQEHQI